MSFSKSIKEEILNSKYKDTSGSKMFLLGLTLSCGSFDEKDKSKFDFVSDVFGLQQKVEEELKNIFHNPTILTATEDYKINKTIYYRIKLTSEICAEILNNDLLKLQNGDIVFIKPLDSLSENQIKAFIKGVFIGAGTSSIIVNKENRKTTGYHIELSHSSYNLLNEIANVFAQYDILAKLVKRKNEYVLYVKDAEEVSNVLALVGANNAVLTLQNEIIVREMRNKINRQTNCISANIKKTAEACYNQLEAINLLDKYVGVENLPADLQEAALLRLANTEESLDDLLKLTKTPLTKSALNYKFQKIIKLAKKFKDKM